MIPEKNKKNVRYEEIVTNSRLQELLLAKVQLSIQKTNNNDTNRFTGIVNHSGKNKIIYLDSAFLVKLVKRNTDSKGTASLFIEFPFNHHRFTTHFSGLPWLSWLNDSLNQVNQFNQVNIINQLNQTNNNSNKDIINNNKNSIERLNYKLQNMNDTLPDFFDNRQKIIFFCNGTFLTFKEIFLEFTKRKFNCSYHSIFQQISRIRSGIETGLVSDGLLVMKIENNEKKYQTSAKGKKILDLAYNKNKEDVVKLRQNVIKEGMDAATQVSIIKDYFENNMEAEIENAIIGNRRLIIDFKKVIKFSLELGNNILDHPESAIKACKMAIDQFDLLEERPEDFTISFDNLPKSENKTIGDIRHQDKDTLITIKGIVSQRSKTVPNVCNIRFGCPQCGSITIITQEKSELVEPKKCNSCGYKGKYSIIKEEHQTLQFVRVEELGSDISNRITPEQIIVQLSDQLTAPDMQQIFNPGNIVEVVGYVKLHNIKSKSYNKTKSLDRQIIFHANSIKNGVDVINLKPTDEETKQMEKLSKNPRCMSILVSNFATDIAAMDDVKESILLMSVSGDVNSKKRQEMHVLLVGDPSTGKSELSGEVNKIVPRSRFASGDHGSGVGITAGVVKDELTGDWSLKAGPLSLATGSVLVLDELDKMKEKNELHTPLEKGIIPVNKAGIHASVPAKTAVLGVMNPRRGNFNNKASFFSQIDLPPALLSRFDFTWLLLDNPNLDTDEQIGMKIFDLDTGTKKGVRISTELLTKYIWKARSYKPKIPREVGMYAITWFKNLRHKAKKDDNATRIYHRQLGGIKRASQSYAKLRFSKEVSIADVNKAIKLFQKSLKHFLDFNPDFFNEIATGVSTKTFRIIDAIKEILINKPLTFDDLSDAFNLLNIDCTNDELKLILSENKENSWEYKKGRYKLVEEN